MTIGDTSQVLAVIIAAGVVIIGPMVAGLYGRQNSVNIMRERWIQKFRAALSEFLSRMHLFARDSPDLHNLTLPQRSAFRTILKLEGEIRLMLNPEQADHKRLLASLDEVMAVLLRDDVFPIEVVHQVTYSAGQITIDSQAVIKEAWDQIAYSGIRAWWRRFKRDQFVD